MVLNEVRKNESGYTLIETVIALALFITVLLPLTTSIGNLFIDRTPEQMGGALRVAEKEMTQISLQKKFTDGTNRTGDGFIVSRTITRSNIVVDIEVIVALPEKPEKPILILCKSIVAY